MIMNMKQESSYRILLLLKLISQKKLSKNEIIEEFKKNNIKIAKTTINNYIEKLQDNDIPIKITKNKNINLYSLDKKDYVFIDDIEVDVAQDVKKLVLLEKNQDIIRSLMKVFYKFALFVDDKDTQLKFLNFGYYSKINWSLVNQLIEHCKNKNIITVDYIMPNGENKYITIHADTLKIGDWSQRLYLSGIFQGDNKLSQLPVDKIFMVKKIVKENIRIDIETNVLTYKVSLDSFKKIGLDKKEILADEKDSIVTIRRPLDDTFFTVQRLMYFCPDLYYISDEKTRNIIKEKLYTLKEMYSDEN